MMTFDLILEHWDTNKFKFVTVEECIDLDDCINHVHQSEPGWIVTKITPSHPSPGDTN